MMEERAKFGCGTSGDRDQPRPATDFRALMRRFGRDQDGSMVVFTLFLILMMILMGGVAVDMMRFETNRSRLQGAIDRAVLAAADLDVCLDPANDPVAIVQNYVARSGFEGMVHNIQVTKGFNSCIVTADARIDVNTIFLKMVSVDQLGAPASSGATETLDDVEISLVLDVSGSMGRDGRIEALRPAASEFVETVMDSIEDDHATISIVPYSTQVNLGPDMFAQYLTRYNHTYSFCIELPASLYTRTDIPVQTRYDQGGHFDPFTGYNSSRITAPQLFNCNPNPNAWVMPFQDDVGRMQTFINALQPDANTSIEMGAKWGVALLDPGTRPVTQGLVGLGRVDGTFSDRPLDFNLDTSLKVLVLMTDGDNTEDWVLNSGYRVGNLSDIWFEDRSGTNERFFVDDPEVGNADGDGTSNERYFRAETVPTSRSWTNTRQGVRMSWTDVWATMTLRDQAYHLRYRQYNNASTYYSWYDNIATITYGTTKDARLAQICTAAKNRGIVIFTIGFNVSDHGAQVMSDCASSPNHFYRIADLDISSAFDSIANQISQLRLIR